VSGYKANRRLARQARVAVAAGAVAALGVVSGVAAQVINAGPVSVATSGESANGSLLAVSNGGSASSGTYQPLACPISTPLPISGSPVNAEIPPCAHADGAAVSTTGTASGATAISGTNTSTGCTAVSGNHAAGNGCGSATVIGVNNYDDEIEGQQVPAFGDGTLQTASTTGFATAPLTGACQSISWTLSGSGVMGALHFGSVVAGLSQAWLSFSGCENGISAIGNLAGSFSGTLSAGSPVSCSVAGGWYQRTVTMLSGQVTGSCAVAGQSVPFTATLAGSFTPEAGLGSGYSAAVVHVSLSLVFTA
jgi:hypothetical protein